MWHTILLVVHVFIAAAMIGLILLQRGKGADAGAAFGAGASGTVFGARGSATFLSKSTAVLATAFFVTSLWLAYLGGQQTEPSSLLDRAGISEPVEGTGTPPLPETSPEPAEQTGTVPSVSDETDQPPESEGS